MGRRIGVLNYKGGTGKTTTVLNLGAGLARRGARVLCVDLDAQGSLATCLGVRYSYSLTHVLLGQAEPQACVVQARDNLDLIASDGTLLQAEGELWRVNDGQPAREILASRMRLLEGEYDYVILDFSPSASIISESGLQYAQELIVPVSMGYMALVGTRQVIGTLKDISRMPGHRVRLYLTEPIRASLKLMQAPSHHMTIYEYSPRSGAKADYEHLVERVLRDG